MYAGGTSSVVYIVCSAPQGSDLGPVLFVLYVADLADIINRHGLGYRTVKKCEDTFIRFDMIHEHDGRTNTQTDAAWRHRPRLCMASRGKNVAANVIS